MIVRLNAYQAVCDLCQAKSEVYHAHQTGALPLPSGWVRRPGTGERSFHAASSERILCPYCAISPKETT